VSLWGGKGEDGKRENRRQEAGNRKQETGDRKQETGDRRQETGDRRQKAGDRRQETVSNRCFQCAKHPPPALRATPASGGQAKPDDRGRSQRPKAKGKKYSDE